MAVSMEKRFMQGVTVLVLAAGGAVGCQEATSNASVEAAKNQVQTGETTAMKGRDISLWPESVSPFTPDPQLEQRIDDILQGMSLEHKVAQMIQPEIRDFNVEDMRRYGFGSFLNGGGAYPNNNKQASVDDWVALAETLYQAGLDDSIDGIAIPPMWGTDAVHGHNNVFGATLFPHNIGLGAAHNPALIEAIAAATAKEVAATGIDWVFAPTVAVARDDRWGRSYESYGEHPELVKAYAEAFVRGMQGDFDGEGANAWLSQQHTLATAKHFIGDGATWEGDDQGDARVSETELVDIHAQGYVSAVAAGVQTIMVSFSSWLGEKNHGNGYLLDQVLKQRMGFDGVLVGDWNGHGQLPGCSIDSCPDAIIAGLDIFMVPTDAWKPLYHNTIEQVLSGDIPQARIDDAVRRILRVKFRAGLFDKPSPANRALSGKAELIGSAEHRALARQAVRESLVLLKNNGNLLPLSPKARVLVVGDGADNIGKQSGGWSVTWQGTDTLNSDFPGATSIYEGIRQWVEPAGGEVVLDSSGGKVLGNWLQGQQKPDVAIVVFGEEPYAEGNGDLANLEYQRGNKRDLQLLQSLRQAGIPVVSVFISGRPLWVNPELNASDAFVAAWLPGTEGGGIADLLFAHANGEPQYDFRGRLSFSWPASPAQGEVNHRDDNPLFARGYGLTLKNKVELPVLDETISQDDASLLPLPVLDGVVKAPWKLWVGDGDNLQQVRTNQLNTPALDIRDIDKRIQQDARRLEFKAGLSGVVRFQADFPQDLRAYGETGSYLVMDMNQPGNALAPLTLGVGCGGQCMQTTMVTADKLNQLIAGKGWQTVSIPLSCFKLSSEQLAGVFIPLQLSSSGDWTLELSNIRWQPELSGLSLECR